MTSLEKELEAARKLVLFADSKTKISVVVDGKPDNHYKDMAFVCWLDYLVLFTKVKKKFPYVIADEFHKIPLRREEKFEMMQALFKHFLEIDGIDDEIRQCLYAIINGTNSLGGRDMNLSTIASYQRQIENLALKLDIKDKKASQDITVLFFYYLLQFVKAKDNKSTKAEIISFLTPFDAESTRQKFSKIYEKADKNFDAFAKDMREVSRLFQMLDLIEISEIIDDDLMQIEKEIEEKL